MKPNERPTEPMRRCSNPYCKHLLTRRDEQAGKCPLCGWLLLTLRQSQAFLVAFVEREVKQ